MTSSNPPRFTLPPQAGLTRLQAALLLRRHGPNRLADETQRALWWQWLGYFRNPLVLVLLAACVVSGLSGDAAGALMIGLIAVCSVTLDFAQAHRAGRAAKRLALQVAVTATVLRDGQPCERPVSDLVPGDVVLLSAGDLVPADGQLTEADDFFVNQAQLTGESFPVERVAATGAAAGALPWRPEDSDTVYLGSSVVSGSARLLVQRTGAATSLGQLALSLTQAAPPTAFELGTRHFGLLIMRLTLLLVLFTLLVNIALQRPLLDSFMFAIALAVGLTPELLPMVVSVTLARGAMRLARLHVIVKRPSAIQDLGAMTVLCTDKTGTLTEASIRLDRHVDASGQDSPAVLRLAYLNSHFESGLKSPLDAAILAHAELDIAGWRKIDEVPFDFERRRVSVLLEHNGARQLVVKGAPEDVLGLCTHYQLEAGLPQPLLPSTREQLAAQFSALGRQGLRVLGIAWRAVPPGHPHAVLSDESALVFAGFAAFLDPPKASARAALRAMHESGVEVKVLTGDTEGVTRRVFQALGVPVRGVLTGTELSLMQDDALRARVQQVNLFCRVNPAQKNRIILALKARGHVVGYLGDGINDAPSLHTADVGISVAGAVDVARQAASLILLRQDLRVLHQGLLEGRRTFGNVMKYILMATSSNFGNMASMAAATLFLPFLPMLPLQILLNNLLYDLSELALPMDRVDAQDLAQPRRWDMGFVRNFMLTIGPVSSLFDLLTFWLLWRMFGAQAELFHTGWFVESVLSQVLVIFVIRTRLSPWRSRPSRWLVASSLGVILIALALPFSGLAPMLGFVPLPPAYFGLLAVLLGTYLLVAEGCKQWFYRHQARH